MNEQPNSYGTGRDPEKKESHLFTVSVLLVAFVAIHILTYLVLSDRQQERHQETESLSLGAIAVEDEEERTDDRCGLGLTLSELSEVQQRYWSLPAGIFVEEVENGSRADAAGLRPGDLLIGVGEQDVTDLNVCLRALEQQCDKNDMVLTYYRDGERYSVSVSLEPTEREETQ